MLVYVGHVEVSVLVVRGSFKGNRVYVEVLGVLVVLGMLVYVEVNVGLC